MKNIYGIFWLFCIATPFAARAELITCEDASGAHAAHLTIRVVRSPGSQPNLEYLYATTKDKEGRPLAYNIVKLVRFSKDKIGYREFLDQNRFTLELDTNILEGENIPGRLALDVGAVFERHFDNLSCTITGLPLVALVPCIEDQASLDAELLRTAKAGSAEKLESLLACGANPNVSDSKSCSPIKYICDLSCGYDPKSSEAPMLSSRSSLVLDSLISALHNFKANLNDRYPDGQTPLMKLARYKQLQGVETLLDLKADVNMQDVRGNTATMLAVLYDDEMLLRTLLFAHPDLNLKNKDGKTAYAIAKEKGFNYLADLLTPQVPSSTIKGLSDGTCTPVMVHLQKNKEIEIVLTGENEMFLLKAPDLGLELMSMPGEPAKQKINPTKTGTFPFTCGIHGGSTQTQGSFMVM